jgi:hypothetical protein
MKFTGNNTLYLPQRTKNSFVLSDILVDSLSKYSVSFDSLSGEGAYSAIKGTVPLFTLESGYISFWSGFSKISTYNTGEIFSVSGWFDNSTGLYLGASDSNIFTNLVTGQGNPLGAFRINCPSNSSLKANISISQTPISFNFSIPNFNIDNSPTGILTSDSSLLIYGIDTFFYQSYETLLKPINNSTGIITSTGSYNIVLSDGDSSSQANNVVGSLIVKSLWGDVKLDINTNRSISQFGNYWQMSGINSDSFIDCLFDGTWSGNSFNYQDQTGNLTLNYRYTKTDSFGNRLSKTLRWGISGVGNASGSFISGIQMTASGEYATLPVPVFTGYYYVTGLQQNLSSMLFSSGCSGNLPVGFSIPIGMGTGASGILNTHAVMFQDIYTPGINTFYVVDNFSLYNAGTGYISPPNAVINTGIFGTNCYDVPRKYAYNISNFLPFSTSGAMAPKASFLTGQVLYTTGLVSGGLATGYFITGLDIGNIGSGYNNQYFPKVSFIRQPGDTLTKNASGNFVLTNTSINPTGLMDIDFKIGNNSWQQKTLNTGLINSEYIDSNEDSFSFKFSLSGVKSTYPWSAYLLLGDDNGTSIQTAMIDLFRYTRFYNTGVQALKKNNSVSGSRFISGNLLNFLVSQDDLDNLYNSLTFSDNNGFDVGDLNF